MDRYKFKFISRSAKGSLATIDKRLVWVDTLTDVVYLSPPVKPPGYVPGVERELKRWFPAQAVGDPVMDGA